MRLSVGPRLPVVIVGLHSSGKTTLARALASILDVRIFELGFGVRQAAHASDRHVLVEVARDLMGEDPLCLAKSAIARAGLERQNSIFVGPRTAFEFEFLKENLEDPLTVGLKASGHYRQERWRHRHLNYDDTWEQREWQECLWDTAKLVQSCELIVDATDEVNVKRDTVLQKLVRTAASRDRF